MASLNDIETKVQYIIGLLDARTTKTITGVLPLTFTTTEDKLMDWEIMGNDLPGTENLLPNVFRQGVTNAFETPNRITAITPILCNVGDTFSAKAEDGFRFALYIANEAGYQQFTNSTLLDIANRVYDSGWKTIFTKTITETQAKCVIIMVSYSDNSNITPSDAAQSITLVRGSTAPSTYIPYQQGVGQRTENGYIIPLSVNGDTVNLPIGNAPLTAGQSISKTSTGIDIATTEGENTISTTLYNKPEMTIKYK